MKFQASAEYNTFINQNNPTYGAAPAITDANRVITKMLIDQEFPIKYGSGIYPFDAEVEISSRYHITAESRSKTLLWCPTSNFLNMTSRGADIPYIGDISIEANGNILRVQGWTVNAIQEPLYRNCNLISYAEHAFYLDTTTSGGTGAPNYGSKFENIFIYAGPDKACFYGFKSASNVYDNVCDSNFFFNRRSTNVKGTAKAMFWNCSMLDYCNSNISYAGLDYVYLYDEPNSLCFFAANNNVFEANTSSFQAIVKIDTANANIKCFGNQYTGDVSKENGYKFILKVGNCVIKSLDIDVIPQAQNIRNQSPQTIKAVGFPIDSGNTKYRLTVYAPYSGNVGPQVSSLITATQELADEYGFGNIYSADSANISNIQLWNNQQQKSWIVPGTSGDQRLSNAFFRQERTKETISYRIGAGKQWDILNLDHEKTNVIYSYAQWLELHSLNLRNHTWIIVSDIDFGGGNLPLRDGATFIFLGGSFNNGTVINSQTTKFINWKGDANLNDPDLFLDNGPTADRPTTDLISGRRYFDTDLEISPFTGTVPIGFCHRLLQVIRHLLLQPPPG